MALAKSVLDKKEQGLKEKIQMDLSCQILYFQSSEKKTFSNKQTKKSGLTVDPSLLLTGSPRGCRDGCPAELLPPMGETCVELLAPFLPLAPLAAAGI